MQEILSAGQVAKLLKIKPHQLDYAHVSQSLQEPETRFAGKRVYTHNDLLRVADHFGQKLDLSTISANTETEAK